MATRPDNVLVLPGREGARNRQSGRIEALRATIMHLDQLACSLQQFSPCMSWSAQRCMIESTALRMRLTSARRSLDDLPAICLFGDQGGARWALQLNDARLEAERRLHDVDVCFHTLQRTEGSLAERDRGVEMFASNRSELLTVISEIRHLITEQATAELGEN